MNKSDQQNKIVALSVGEDLVLAQALVASLTTAGIDTELVLSHDPYVGLEHTSPHRLMIRERDIDEARPVIESHLEDDPNPRSQYRRRRGARDVVALGLLLAVGSGPVIGLVLVVRQLLDRV